MAEQNDLVPVFIPPLAATLAHAEEIKGSRLSETEVVRLRDKAACMMMRAHDAYEMAVKRGYRDVEPENCWADWHRLRVQLTGDGYLPKIVLCLLGSADFEAKAHAILENAKVEYEWREADERMPKAFEASVCRFDHSLTENDVSDIAGHSKVLYMLSPNYSAQEAAGITRSFLHLAQRLLDAGALALKSESSGIAHGRARWLELAREADQEQFWSALIRAFVQMPIFDGDDYWTCGLHLLGKPDLIVADSLLRQGFGSTEQQSWAAVDLFRVFANYWLGECRDGQFFSGHTFSVDTESPRFRVTWEECVGYDEDEFFFNPFGRMRFSSSLK